jgi:hypothetical protein
LFADFFPVHQVAQLKGESQCVVNSDLKSDTNSSTLLLSVYFYKNRSDQKRTTAFNKPSGRILFLSRTFDEQEKKAEEIMMIRGKLQKSK